MDTSHHFSPASDGKLTMVGSIAELEKSLIVERIKAGMRRAKIEGRQLGRAPLDIDRDALVQDRLSGMSLTQVSRKHRVSRATVCRLMKEIHGGSQGSVSIDSQVADSERVEVAA